MLLKKQKTAAARFRGKFSANFVFFFYLSYYITDTLCLSTVKKGVRFHADAFFLYFTDKIYLPNPMRQNENALS